MVRVTKAPKVPQHSGEQAGAQPGHWTSGYRQGHSPVFCLQNTTSECTGSQDRRHTLCHFRASSIKHLASAPGFAWPTPDLAKPLLKHRFPGKLFPL